MGCSKQYVQQLLDDAVSTKFKIRAWYKHSIIYPNIDKWVKNNNLSLTKFAELCGINVVTLRNFIVKGYDGRKRTIDAVLNVTGMTYEEAFAKGDDENGTD